MQVRVDIKKIAMECGVVLTLASLFTFFAVYDSDKMPFTERFLFWGSTIGAGWLVAVLARPKVNRLLADQSAVIQMLTLSAVVSAPIPLILFWFDTGFQQAWPIWNWVLQYCLAFVIVILLLTGHYITLKAIRPASSPIDHDGTADTRREQMFLKRLPIEFHGATLYAVSSEDHYLRIHTDRGETLILMRLADALRELESADGMQTHRSWWVARRGIAKMTGKQSLTLKSGREVPIARSRAKKTRKTFSS